MIVYQLIYLHQALLSSYSSKALFSLNFVLKLTAFSHSRIWSHRSEVVERLLAQKCELCGATDKIEVHHIRKLADLEQKGKSERPDWMKKMAARHRKTLVVCLECHHKIHYGRYGGNALSR